MISTDDMLNLQSFFPDDLKIISIENNTDAVIIHLKSKTHSSICPKCGKRIDCYHATHRRKVQDLPILGKRTMLMLSLYEFKCSNTECGNVSVTETFYGFLNHYDRMTERLADFVSCLAIETSCEGAARILNSLNVRISGDTVIRTLIKRYGEQPAPQCGSSIGVDDFAFKKRHTYGTIIVDGKTHEPVAVLDGRDGKSLKEWLLQNKHVKTVTRDRASAYASAVKEILPDAMQIADRFHLHQNLLEAIRRILGRELPASIAVSKEQEEADSVKNEHPEENGKKNAAHCG